jgi:hypothetical protein
MSAVLRFPIELCRRAKPPSPISLMDAWIDELDAEGAFPNPLKAHMLLARCPEPDHPTARWLAEYVSRSKLTDL